MKVTDEFGRVTTVAEMHTALVGKKVKLPVATGYIFDTTVGESGQVYVAIKPHAVADTFNCGGWIKLEEVTFLSV
jgi:hypothetical protein